MAMPTAARTSLCVVVIGEWSAPASPSPPLEIDIPSGALTSATRLAAGSRPTFFA